MTGELGIETLCVGIKYFIKKHLILKVLSLKNSQFFFKIYIQK